MALKNIFKFGKKTKTLQPPHPVNTPVKLEVEVKVVVNSHADVPVHEDVHVRMTFDEFGNMITREVVPLKTIEVLPPQVSAITLVEIPPMQEENSPMLEVKEPVPTENDLQPVLVTQLSTMPPTSPTPSLPAMPAMPAMPSMPSTLSMPSIPTIEYEELTTAFKADVEDPLGPRDFTTGDFHVLGVLGRGGQGTVFLVRDRGSQVLYALKAIAKRATSKWAYSMIFSEQDILKRVAGNPRFLSLQASFQDEDYFYFLTDFYLHGDLKAMMVADKVFSEERARMYSAQIVLALEELHKLRIIHRDIKPENILIDDRGQLVIADFGLARAFGRTVEEQPWRMVRRWMLTEDVRDVDKGTYAQCRSVCGTPKYIAPEICGKYVNTEVYGSDGVYSFPVDIWSFGVILFEMLHGKLPFNIMDNEDQEVQMTHSTVDELVMDDGLSEDARDLLAMVLSKDPNKRPGWDIIKEHPWFDTFDWSKVAHPKATTPMVFDEDMRPSNEVRNFTFGKPYNDCEVPYPHFQWVAHRHYVRPSASASVSDIAASESTLERLGWPVASSTGKKATFPVLTSPPSPMIPKVIHASHTSQVSLAGILYGSSLSDSISQASSASLSSMCSAVFQTFTTGSVRGMMLRPGELAHRSGPPQNPTHLPVFSLSSSPTFSSDIGDDESNDADDAYAVTAMDALDMAMDALGIAVIDFMDDTAVEFSIPLDDIIAEQSVEQSPECDVAPCPPFSILTRTSFSGTSIEANPFDASGIGTTNEEEAQSADADSASMLQIPDLDVVQGSESLTDNGADATLVSVATHAAADCKSFPEAGPHFEQQSPYSSHLPPNTIFSATSTTSHPSTIATSIEIQGSRSMDEQKLDPDGAQTSSGRNSWHRFTGRVKAWWSAVGSKGAQPHGKRMTM